MRIKNKLLLLMIFICGISCSVSREELIGTKWINDEGNIYCNFTSKNTVDIMYNDISDNYLFYIENNKIKITNKINYSQYVIEYSGDELLFDSEIAKISPKTTIKLHRTNKNIARKKEADIQTEKPAELQPNQPGELPANQQDNTPLNLPAKRPMRQPADMPN